MKLTTTNKDAVEEYPYGMYVWVTPDGWVVQDDDCNVMNVFCMKGDRRAIDAIRQAAAYWGFPEGKPVWWSGRRRIDDEEFEHQISREQMGLVPDPFDFAAIKEEEKALKQNGQR